MSKRSVIFGFLGAAIICGLCFFNDHVLNQTHLVGNYMPVFVYGLLFVFTACVNPLLGRFRLKAAELSVVMLITLVPCCLPGSGLLRTFFPTLVLPYHYNKTITSWRANNVLSLVPDGMLADISTNEDTVLGGMIQGLSEGSKHVEFSEIPWGAWQKPLLFWLPIILSILFACLALAVIIHRQWCEHEHLQYPIAMYANAMMPDENGRTAIFHNRLFWIGFAYVLAIYINNYLYQWYPEYVIPVQTRLRLWPFHKVLKLVYRGGSSWSLLNPAIFYSVIGFAFFIPTDASLAFGLGPWLWSSLNGMMLNYGINLERIVEGGDGYTAPRPKTFMLFGSNFGLFAVMLYTGRYYYGKVVKAMFGVKSDEVGEEAAWAARTFTFFILLFVGLLIFRVGIDWPLAVLYTLMMVVFFTVIARIVCESGLFHVQVSLFPCAILWGIIGSSNLGPKMIFLMQMISIIVTCDPRENMMPFATNGLKLIQKYKQPIGRTAFLAGCAIVLGLLIALPITLYFHYDHGFATNDSWANVSVPRMTFNNAMAVMNKLKAQGVLEQAGTVTGLSRFLEMKPHAFCTWCFIIGFVLVLLMGAAKLRYTWWPLSPLLLVTWNTSHLHAFAGSFLIGCVIKSLVLKFGGNKTYNKLKPLMVGMITGEIMGSLIPSIIALIFYLVTGEPPKAFHVFLG